MSKSQKDIVQEIKNKSSEISLSTKSTHSGKTVTSAVENNTTTYEKIKKLMQDFKDILLVLVSCIAIVVSLIGINKSEKSIKMTNRAYVVLNGIREIPNNEYRFIVSNYGVTPSYNTKIFYDTFIGDSTFIPKKNFTKINKDILVLGAQITVKAVEAKISNTFHSDSLET
jgi:hypothetical protein